MGQLVQHDRIHAPQCSMHQDQPASSVAASKSPEHVLQRAHVLGSVAASLNKTDLLELGNYAYSLKALQQELIVHFWDEHGGGPLLIQYSQDTTPLSRRQHLSKSKGATSARKTLKVGGDVLVQQVFISAPVGLDRYEHALFFGPPIPVMHGKSTKALAAFANVCPGINSVRGSLSQYRLRHVVFDRGVPADVGHYVSGLWAASCRDDAAAHDPQGVDEPALFHYELHTAVSCAAHDSHSALKWSQHKLHENAQFLTNAYVAMAARRAVLGECVAALSTWLCEVVDFVPLSSSAPYAPSEMMWATLGVDVDVYELFCKHRLRWNRGRLEVLESALLDENWLANVSSSLLQLWRFPPFTASRWCTLGESARCYAIGALTGFESLCEWLVRNGKVGEFDKNGLAKMETESLKEFFAVTGLCAYMPECLLASLLEDPRLAVRSEDLWQEVLEEHQKLQALPQEVWQLLQPVCPALSAAQLQDRTLHASLRCLAFLQHRIFRVTSSMPWVLCTLGAESAVELLRTMDASDAEDPVTAKLRLHLELGESDAKVQSAVALLRECAWTSHQSERQHASGAQVKKHHAELGLETMVLRAYLHSICQQLPSKSVRHTKAARLQRKMASLLRKSPARVGGRQMFFKDILEKMRLANAKRPSSRKPFSQLGVMNLHAKHWEALSGAARARYEREAEVQKLAAAEKWREEFEALDAALDLELLREQQEAQAAGNRGVRVSAARWPAWAASRLSELLQASPALHTKNKVVRAEASLGPKPVEEEAFLRKCNMSFLPRCPLRQTCDAYKSVCRLRSSFETTVFGFEDDGGLTWLRVAFCTASPCELFCYPLVLLPADLTSPGLTPTQWLSTAADATEAQWQLAHGFTVRSDDWLASRSLNDVMVFIQTDLRGDGLLRARCHACPLGYLLHSLIAELAPDPACDKGSRSSEQGSLAGRQNPGPAAGSMAGAPASASLNASAVPPEDAAAVEEAVREAEARYTEISAAAGRAAADEDAAEEEDARDFRTSVLGGMWQVSRTGRSIYGLRVDCKAKSDVFRMAAQLLLPRSASFEYNKYTEDSAAALVELYKHRMSFLKRLWLQEGECEKLPPSKVASYAIPGTLQAKLDGAGRAVQKRSASILQLGLSDSQQ